MLCFHDHDPGKSKQQCPKIGPPRMVRKIVEKLSRKRSPDCEGEFIEMFPTDRLSIFDGIWAVPRHFFSMSQKKCLTGYFCVTFRADHFPQILFFIAPTWGRFWPILVFCKNLIFRIFFVCFLCIFCVYVALFG